MKTIISSILVVAALGLISCGNKAETDSKEVAQDQNKEQFDDKSEKKDAAFAVAAADGGLLEVKLGELAASKGTAQEIKLLGKTISDDHERANAELGAMAEEKKISIPNTLSEENQKKYDEIAAKTGPEFDKAYAAFMVNDHHEDIDKFRNQAENGTDEELKRWAARKVPALEQHLMLAENAAKVVNAN